MNFEIVNYILNRAGAKKILDPMTGQPAREIAAYERAMENYANAERICRAFGVGIRAARWAAKKCAASLIHTYLRDHCAGMAWDEFSKVMKQMEPVEQDYNGYACWDTGPERRTIERLEGDPERIAHCWLCAVLNRNAHLIFVDPPTTREALFAHDAAHVALFDEANARAKRGFRAVSHEGEIVEYAYREETPFYPRHDDAPFAHVICTIDGIVRGGMGKKELACADGEAFYVEKLGDALNNPDLHIVGVWGETRGGYRMEAVRAVGGAWTWTHFNEDGMARQLTHRDELPWVNWSVLYDRGDRLVSPEPRGRHIY